MLELYEERRHVMADGYLAEAARGGDVHAIPRGQAANPIDDETLTVDEVYVKVRLRSARIPLSRSGFSKFFGVVHAFSRTNDRKSGVSEFHVVTSPSKLEAIDCRQIDHVVMGTRLLLGPVVYRGGLEIDVGLFSVVTTNLAVPYLTLARPFRTQQESPS
jgi:hypothetical protein